MESSKPDPIVYSLDMREMSRQMITVISYHWKFVIRKTRSTREFTQDDDRRFRKTTPDWLIQVPRSFGTRNKSSVSNSSASKWFVVDVWTWWSQARRASSEPVIHQVKYEAGSDPIGYWIHYGTQPKRLKTPCSRSQRSNPQASAQDHVNHADADARNPCLEVLRTVRTFRRWFSWRKWSYVLGMYGTPTTFTRLRLHFPLQEWHYQWKIAALKLPLFALWFTTWLSLLLEWRKERHPRCLHCRGRNPTLESCELSFHEMRDLRSPSDKMGTERFIAFYSCQLRTVWTTFSPHSVSLRSRSFSEIPLVMNCCPLPVRITSLALWILEIVRTSL